MPTPPKTPTILTLIAAALLAIPSPPLAADGPPKPDPSVSEVDDREEIVPTVREFTINWFARTQSDEGHWPCEFEYDFIIDGDPSLRRGEKGYDVGVTASVLLVWPAERISAGETDPYAKGFARALDWLLKQQKPDGTFGDRKNPAWLLQHAIATRFLTTALHSYPEPDSLIPVAVRGLKVLADTQRKDGCWRLDGKDDALLTVHADQAFVWMSNFMNERGSKNESWTEIATTGEKTIEWFRKGLGSRNWSKSTGQKKTNAKLPKKRAEALSSLAVLRFQSLGPPYAPDAKDYRENCEEVFEKSVEAIESGDIDSIGFAVEILTPRNLTNPPKPPADTVHPEFAKAMLTALAEIPEQQIKEGTFRGSWAAGHKKGLPSSIHYHTARLLEIAILDGWQREGMMKFLNERAAAAENDE